MSSPQTARLARALLTSAVRSRQPSSTPSVNPYPHLKLPDKFRDSRNFQCCQPTATASATAGSFPLVGERGGAPRARERFPMTTLAAQAGLSSTEIFHEALQKAQNVVVLTGAGISAASGIPTFRGPGGLWRTWNATELATPEAFSSDPSLVWEFYHYRRGIVAAARPNPGHVAIADLQKWCQAHTKKFSLITQNIDRLHHAAGSADIIELHGSLWVTRCTVCGLTEENRDMPICQALADKGSPDPSFKAARIAMEDLPRCHTCGGLLRPHVVWFGECLERAVLDRVDSAVEQCDVFIVVGTSAVVYPAAGYARLAQALGAKVAEFNLEETSTSDFAHFTFHGDSNILLPQVLQGIL